MFVDGESLFLRIESKGRESRDPFEPWTEIIKHSRGLTPGELLRYACEPAANAWSIAATCSEETIHKRLLAGETIPIRPEEVKKTSAGYERAVAMAEILLSGSACYYCGYPALNGRKMQTDHVTPTQWGGTDTPDNLVAACRVCNQRKYDRGYEAFRGHIAHECGTASPTYFGELPEARALLRYTYDPKTAPKPRRYSRHLGL